MQVVWAHGLTGRADLPVPLTAFYWAAAVVLVVSFIGLWRGWRRPLLAGLAPDQDVSSSSVSRLQLIAGMIGFAAFVLVVAAALVGSTDLNRNIAPVAVFVAWWIGIAVLAGSVGDVWRFLHPIAGLARALRVPESRRPWPTSWGVWIAFIGLLAFCWLELVYPTASHVRLLGWLMVAWATLTLGGMWRYGVATWLDHGEPFAIYTRVLSHMAIRRHGRWGWPVVGLTRLRAGAGMAAFVGLLIGSISFDGLSRTLWWKQRVAMGTVSLVQHGIEPRTAQLIFGTVGMLAMVAAAIGAFLVASSLARLVGRLPRRSTWGDAASAFSPSLVPIALAYVVAHYFSFFWFQVQQLIPLASDPLGRGIDLFGTADYAVDYSTLTPNMIWAVQLGSIVVGHVLGLVLAHDRALEIERQVEGSRAVWSQWPMLALMILYTVGGLYFLSEGLNV